MSLDALNGLTLEPMRVRIAAAKVAEYVAATGDDPDAWDHHAPPSYAGAILFMAAPLLLERPDVKAYTKVLVHVDQQFAWHGPLAVGTLLTLRGSVSKVRSRGASTFVSFEVAAEAEDGPLLKSTSTFLLGEEPAAEPGVDHGEPPAGQRGPNEQSGAGADPRAMAKSASRVDLVRYAGASGDFNPIHYDHVAARGAGLDGIVVHGLLMGAWMAQVAAAGLTRPDPLSEMRLRFRAALRPAVATTVTAVPAGEHAPGLERVDLAVRADGVDLVTGHATAKKGRDV